MAELSVQIGADIKDLQKKLSQAIKGLDELKIEQKELTKLYKIGAISADKYYDGIAKNSIKLTKASGTVRAYKKSINDLSNKGLDPLTKSTANAVPATQEFSRIIQDAPFGIQGVANNITQLTDQFGNLTRKTGSSGAALKAMLSTLSGPAGILLAVSAVTSLMVSYGDEILNLISSNNALAASQKAVNKALNEFYGDQVTKINTYVSILEDVNTSETQRKNITEELIKIVPSLTKADFAYGSNLDIVRSKIGDYVLAQASRIEADTLVEENSAKLAKKARIIQIQSIDDQQKRIEAFRKFLDKEGVRTNRTSITSTYASQGQNVERKATKDEIVSDFYKLAKEIETELAPIQERLDQLYSTTFNGGLEKGGSGGLGDKSKRAKIKPVFDFELPQDAQKRYNDFAKNALLLLTDNFNTGNLDKPIIDVSLAFSEIDAFVQKFKEGTSEVKESSLDLGSFLANSFSSLGESLGDVFSGVADGGDVFEGLMATVAAFMKQLGESLIATGVAGLAFKKLLANPVAAIVAGTALVALSGAVKNKLSAPSFAKGGFSGDDNLAYLNKNELVLRPFEQAALYNVLKGTGISGVSNNNQSSGGNDMVGSVILRGQNQVVQLRRAEKRMKRKFNS